MSSDADAHKVGLIPVTLMVSGNIMRSGVFCYLQTGLHWQDCHLWMVVTIIGALGLSMVYAKMSFLDPSPWFLRLRLPLLWAVSRLSNQRPLLAGLLDRQYRHGGHWRRIFKYFFPILKDPLVLTITCVVVLWIFVLLNIVGPKMITRVQAVATVLALIPIVGIAVFGWFWFRGETYMAAWNVMG